ncbi:MAG: sigma-70 family RNA polymerase sigma factor, partial [Gemmatimonadota bacterium]|nr:sigma-70 family RNA polymerase sigma factor [Gemmatimonadota bacterium]
MTSDRELAERLADRDESALAALYDRTSARAYGLALSILGDGREAEEAVSDGFLQVWENAAEFSSERGGLDAWLLTVVRSRALDRLRTRKRRKRLADAAERDVASFTVGTTRSDPEAAHLARVTLEGR